MFQGNEKGIAVVLVAAVLALVARPALADQDPVECSGQGFATLLMKGSCELGASLKVKMAGRPFARYKLFRSVGTGPTEVEGVGTFCLEFGPDRELVGSGRFGPLGFATLWTEIPSDPDLIGEDLAFQFVAEDEESENGVAISNAMVFPVCAPGIRCLGYFTVVQHDGQFPATVATRAFRADDEEERLGEIVFEYDPQAPPALPIVDGDLMLAKIERHGPFLVLHAVARGCDLEGGRLFDETVFETEAGSVATSVQIETSGASPIGTGSRFPPLFVTFVNEVDGAPEEDCRKCGF